MAFSLTLSPSPLRVLDRAVLSLRQDIGRLLLAMTLFFLLPYLAGYFIVYKPLIDGSHTYSQGFSADYLVRYYGFIVWYFLLNALSFCVAGRILHDRMRGVATTFFTAVCEVPWLWLRGLLPYLVLAGLTYVSQAWVAPGVVIALVSTFFLPPFVLERQGLVTAVKTGWSLCRGRVFIGLVNIGLLVGFTYGAQWLIGWANSRFAPALSFAGASVALNIAYALIRLVTTAFMLAIYACCRRLARPPGVVAEVFD